MAIVIKQIKPAALKQDAMRLELLNAMRKAGTQIKKDFEATTRTWEHKPKFEVVISLTGPGPVVLVDTDDEIYGYVSKGTKPHEIWAGIYTGKSNKKTLAFPARSTSKTKPGFIGSFGGSRSSQTVVRPYVNHPGTKARNFDETIQKRRQTWFKGEMEKAMAKAAKASGYGA